VGGPGFGVEQRAGGADVGGLLAVAHRVEGGAQPQDSVGVAEAGERGRAAQGKLAAPRPDASS
jgi:hypothetical protein